jgi:hypothetical protein
VKYIPTITEYPVLAEGPKTYRVKTDTWHTRGKMVDKARVDDGEYGIYFSTVDNAWRAYLKHLANAQKEASRRQAEIADKIRLAIAAMRATGIAP